jgi:phage recombination protein Bet
MTQSYIEIPPKQLPGEAEQRVKEKVSSPCMGCDPNSPDSDCQMCESMTVKTIQPEGTLTPIQPKYSNDELLLLRHVIAKDCTEPEFKLMMYMAKTYGLDPLVKQIWAIKRNERDAALIMVGRDGMLAIAHRSGQFDGMNSGVNYVKDKEGKEIPVTAWCEIWRKDMAHSFKTEVRFDEYVQPIPKSGYKGLWQTKPSVMLIKVAESVCLRKAFSVSGVYDPDEIPERS